MWARGSHGTVRGARLGRSKRPVQYRTGQERGESRRCEEHRVSLALGQKERKEGVKRELWSGFGPLSPTQP